MNKRISHKLGYLLIVCLLGVNVPDHLTLNEGDRLLTIRLGLKENPSGDYPAATELRFTGAGEFGDYDDHVLEGVTLLYARLDQKKIEDYISNILVYPNPARDKLTIRNAKGSEVTVTDITGRKLLELQNVSDNEEINLERYVTGAYMLMIKRDNDVILRKVIVSK